MSNDSHQPFVGIAGLVWDAMRRWPDEIAVVDGEHKLSYRELAADCCSIMATLRQRGVKKDDLVAVRLDRGVSQIAALISILGVGAYYVPISTNESRSGQRQIITLSRPVIGIGHGEQDALEWLDIERLERVHDGTCGVCRPGEALGGDLSYLYFTSGSSGKPKGVLTGAACAVKRIDNAVRYFGLKPGVAVVNKTPLIFDVSILEIFSALVSGASLRVVPKSGEIDAQLLSDAIASLDSESILIHFVPTAFRLFAELIGSQVFPKVTYVLTTGEGVDAQTLKRILTVFPNASYVNMYGQTETSEVTSWEWPAGRGDQVPDTVPAGRALDGYQVLVVNDELEILPDGEVGEIYVAGEEALAAGYLDDPRTTSTSFIANPVGEAGSRWYRTGDLGKYSEGCLEVLGRSSGYIKLNGVRVELSGIENIIRQHPGITEVAALADDSEVLQFISVFYTGSADAFAVREYCGESLPPHMVPAALTHLPELPQTESGKISKESVRRMYIEGNRNDQWSGTIQA